jgi:hypothetical protein
MPVHLFLVAALIGPVAAVVLTLRLCNRPLHAHRQLWNDYSPVLRGWLHDYRRGAEIASSGLPFILFPGGSFRTILVMLALLLSGVAAPNVPPDGLFLGLLLLMMLSTVVEAVALRHSGDSRGWTFVPSITAPSPLAPLR